VGSFGIVVIDPHPLYRFGLEQACLACPKLRVISSVGTGEAGRAAIRDGPADVAVLDLALPDMRGLSLLTSLADERCRTPVVVLTTECDPATIYAALAAGAAGYLTKDAESATVIDALCAAAAGDCLISPHLHRLVAAEIRLRANGTVKLTSRERQILALVAEGLSSLDIGRRLYLSHTTVKTHLGHAYEKLGVSDRAAAVAQALKRGLLDPVSPQVWPTSDSSLSGAPIGEVDHTRA
jgi:two-component system nitrate/nitrite response regulator NarL